jgi:hypothetical protein
MEARKRSGIFTAIALFTLLAVAHNVSALE